MKINVLLLHPAGRQVILDDPIGAAAANDAGRKKCCKGQFLAAGGNEGRRLLRPETVLAATRGSILTARA
jgi:hypothetical protein